MELLGLKIEKRIESPPTLHRILVPVLSVVLAFVITSVLLVTEGADLGEAFGAFLSFIGSITGMAEIIVKAIPLLLISLGLTVAFRCKVFNIGAEGQLIMGAIIATWIGITFRELPSLVIIPLIIALGFLIGGFWGAIAGTLKAKFGINEVIVTIMLNYVAIYLLEYLVIGPMGVGGTWPRSPIITESAWLPRLVTGTRFHAGFFIAILFAILVWIFLFRTGLGYQIRVTGASIKAARYGGTSPPKMIVIAMLLSGGLAGIAGTSEVMGVHHYLVPGLSAGYGFIGIVVAWLGRLHPVWMTLTAIGFSAVIYGTQAMLSEVGIALETMWVTLGLIMIFFMVVEVLTQYRIRRAR